MKRRQIVVQPQEAIFGLLYFELLGDIRILSSRIEECFLANYGSICLEDLMFKLIDFSVDIEHAFPENWEGSGGWFLYLPNELNCYVFGEISSNYQYAVETEIIHYLTPNFDTGFHLNVRFLKALERIGS